MNNFALREMISSIRYSRPSIELHELTTLLAGLLPEKLHLHQWEVQETVDAITDFPGSLGYTSSSLPGIVQDRDDEYDTVIVKQAFESFRDRERAYFLMLDPLQRSLMGLDSDEPPWRAALGMRHHVEFLLTFKSVKPCTLISPVTAASVFNGMTVECLRWVFDQYDLATYGFRLKYLPIKIFTDAEDLHRKFRGDRIIASTRSGKWPLVKEIFFDGYPGQVHREEAVYEALGYPVKSGAGRVRFYDRTEAGLLVTAAGGGGGCGRG